MDSIGQTAHSSSFLSRPEPDSSDMPTSQPDDPRRQQKLKGACHRFRVGDLGAIMWLARIETSSAATFYLRIRIAPQLSLPLSIGIR